MRSVPTAPMVTVTDSVTPFATIVPLVREPSVWIAELGTVKALSTSPMVTDTVAPEPV